MDPLKLLQDDLKDDDVELAITSISRLSTIANAMGPTRTRTELLQFLDDYTDQENDEAHTHIARQLAGFVPLVGGKNHAPCLLPVMEKFCQAEEVVVRDQCVKSLGKLCSEFTEQDLVDHVVPLLKRLSAGEWFTARVSACGLFAPLYKNLPANPSLKRDLRQMFIELHRDDSPMVRKSASVNFSSFVDEITATDFKAEFLAVLNSIVLDPIDTLRELAVDACISCAGTLDVVDYTQDIVPIIIRLQEDPSWRVRKSLSSKFPQLIQAVDTSVTDKIFSLYVKLLRDLEDPLRRDAVDNLGKVSAACVEKGVSRQTILLLNPVLEPLSQDQNESVKTGFATHLLSLCKPYGAAESSRMIVPLIHALVKDENSIVKSNIVDNVHLLVEAIDSQSMIDLIPTLLFLSKDPKWRVRLAVVSKSGVLAGLMEKKTFESQISTMLVEALSDHVFAIRQEAATQISQVVKTYGDAWARTSLFPSAFSIYDKNTNYLFRMVCLDVIIRSAPFSDSSTSETIFLPLALQAASDAVVNVRMRACQAFQALISKLPTGVVQNQLVPLLTKLEKDTDSDVKYEAGQALSKA